MDIDRSCVCIFCSQETASVNEVFFCHECVRFPPKSLPINPSQRVQNEMYLHKGTPVYWRGKILFCVHNVRRTTCKHTMCCDLKTHCEHELPLSSPCVKCARP